MDAIHRMGHVVLNDWVMAAALRLQENRVHEEEIRWGLIAPDARASILNADVVIVEASGRGSFGSGFEAALALQMKKPCLFLIKKGEKATSYSAGISDERITKKFYDVNNLTKIVEEFLRLQTVKAKDLRFNFVIDKQIYHHLRHKSIELGKTKAEVVRDILLEEMKELDK